MTFSWVREDAPARNVVAPGNGEVRADYGSCSENAPSTSFGEQLSSLLCTWMNRASQDAWDFIGWHHVRTYNNPLEKVERSVWMSDSDRNQQQQEYGPEQPPHAPPREHVREMQNHLQEMEEYLRRMGERLRRLDEHLSHLEAEDDRAVDRGRGWPTGG